MMYFRWPTSWLVGEAHLDGLVVGIDADLLAGDFRFLLVFLSITFRMTGTVKSL